MNKTGIIYGVNGPVIYLKGDPGFKISEMVYVGPEKLVGEVIGLKKGYRTGFRGDNRTEARRYSNGNRRCYFRSSGTWNHS